MASKKIRSISFPRGRRRQILRSRRRSGVRLPHAPLRGQGGADPAFGSGAAPDVANSARARARPAGFGEVHRLLRRHSRCPETCPAVRSHRVSGCEPAHMPARSARLLSRCYGGGPGSARLSGCLFSRVEPHRERIRKMPWHGSWSGGAFTGTYTADDGTVFAGTWTPPEGQDPPGRPPPSIDPIGLPPNSSQPHQGPWQGSYDASGVWRGKYTEPNGTVFEGTMTKPHP